MKGRVFFSTFLYIGFLHPSFSQNQDFDSLYKEFKSGNYNHVANQSKLIIQNNETLSQDLRFLVLYVATESNLEEMDQILEKVYQSNDKRPVHLTNAMYLILERALVSNSVAVGEKWGYRFRQEAENSSRYAEGLYFYSSLLYQNQKEKDALYISKLALGAKPDANLNNRIQVLQSVIQKSSSNK